MAVGVGGVSVSATPAVALLDRPPEIRPGRDGVEVLPIARSGVLGHRLAVRQEGETPGIAQTICVDVRHRSGDVDERVVTGDRSVEVEAEDLAVDVGERLPIAD